MHQSINTCLPEAQIECKKTSIISENTLLSDYYNNPTESCNLNTIVCLLCNNTKGTKDNYVILSCNHVFHVHCLAQEQFAEIYNFPVIDEDYFNSRKCLVCNKRMQSVEIMFLHSKFLNGTRDKIDSHNRSIQQLEEKLSSMKEELRICYDYKHKLERERENSKQILATIATRL